MLTSLLIANRGEIACRIIRTARRLGIRTVAVYSEADARSQHVRQADLALPIGGPRPAESYLRGDAIIDAALAGGAQAIHPGYGFLSENADFAEQVERAGLIFVGPSADSMRRMGSKAGAKNLMSAHGVPVVPGYTGEGQDPAVLAREAERIGYPLMIKAAHGGGGKGMRVVHDAASFESNLSSCQREARGAFGRDRVLLERYIERPRHIEIQIFGDRHGNLIHLNERECSAQRRYQKVLEESPSVFLDASLRARMGAAAVAAGRALDYVNAGTVEFIVGPAGDFYFMEINTRLQVEHPVTEQVLGLDLVAWQLAIASGEPLPLQQSEVRTRGHAIEVRLYAEDPEKNFLPGSGRLERLALPAQDAHVRIDAGVIEGDAVSIFYDPMIAKLIVHDVDRPAALARLREALAVTDIAGPRSNVEFLERLVRHRSIVDGDIDTGFLDRHLDDVLPQSLPPSSDLLFAAACVALLDDECAAARRAASSIDPHSPWAIADGWRLGHRGKRLAVLGWRGDRHEIAAHGHGGTYALDIAGQRTQAAGACLHDGTLSLALDGRILRLHVLRAGAGFSLHDGERRVRFERLRAFAWQPHADSTAGNVGAPMPGRIVEVRTRVGAQVAAGDELLVMEAMKMEITLRATRAGAIASLGAVAGDFVEADAVLVRYEEETP
jgi:3-methylcrotonyl-CoA carboxylase alpha subunit